MIWFHNKKIKRDNLNKKKKVDSDVYSFNCEIFFVFLKLKLINYQTMQLLKKLEEKTQLEIWFLKENPF